MGVPKFFRWLGERYPLCMQLVERNAIPEFDHLYLDMNGIIHTCTKPSGRDDLLKLPEEQAMMNIMAYVDLIFKTIRPKKVFFLAIDGVAPRAKMNQQRARRFRAARENVATRKKTEEKLKRNLNPEELWDSNCITPGTEFLTKLAECIRFMICKKIGEDPAWRDVEVIFSGPEVPGEGEHKIMDYIRFRKSQSTYEPNTRHCLYGLDADLIMLALLSHEPHFALLREEVSFGRKSKQSSAIGTDYSSQKFYLLHVCLIREYFDLEFRDLRSKLTFEYDLERIIDDFILFMYFVGNDFLPNLPNFHINDGGLKLMFDEYKMLLPALDGYINDCGSLNIYRLESLIRKLQVIENLTFSRYLEELEELKGRQKSGRQKTLTNSQPVTITAFQWRILKLVRDFIEARDQISLQLDVSPFTPSDFDFLFGIIAECTHLQHHMSNSSAFPSTPQNQNALIVQKVGIVSQEEFIHYCRTILAKYQKILKIEEDPCLRLAMMTQQQGVQPVLTTKDSLQMAERLTWKSHYYQDKLNFDVQRDPQLVQEMVSMYVDGLQWVLHYYYKGVPSWGWYYPYHYAPLISDLVGLKPPKLFLERGKPFFPLEQLMAVLPPFSRDLVPPAFRDLMVKSTTTTTSSPIASFYPTEFQLDMNGKKNEWEAVVLIPFIQEDVLLKAMHEKQHLLAENETRRNQFGHCWIYRHDRLARMFRPSLLPSVWTSLQDCPCYEAIYSIPSEIPESARKRGLCDGYRPLIGFPTLHSLNLESRLRKHRLDLFGFTAESETMVLRVLHNHEDGASTPPHNLTTNTDEEIDSYILSILEKICFINWPFLVEGRIVAVEDALHTYRVKLPLASYESPKTLVKEAQTARSIELFKAEVAKITNFMEHHCAVVIGPVKLLLHVASLKELVSLADGTLAKNFGKRSNVTRYPAQLMVQHLSVDGFSSAERPIASSSDLLKVGLTVFYIGNTDQDTYQTKDDHNGHLTRASKPSYYGRLGIILAQDDVTRQLTLDIFEPYSHQISRSVIVAFKPPKSSAQPITEPDKMNQENRNKTVVIDGLDYQSDDRVASVLNISQRVVSKIASSYLLQCPKTTQKYNVGLNLKFETRREKVEGYTRRNNRSNRWEYSTKAVDLLRRYISTFPQLVAHASRTISSNDMIYEGEEEDLKRMKLWLREQHIEDLPRSPVDSQILGTPEMLQLQQFIDSYRASYFTRNPRPIRLYEVPPNVILIPTTAHLRLTQQTFSLYDRVILVAAMTGIVHAHSTVSVGSYGTVVGVRYPNVDILLDESTPAANDLSGRCESHRGITVSRSSLLNLTHVQSPLRQPVWHPVDDLISLPAQNLITPLKKPPVVRSETAVITTTTNTTPSPPQKPLPSYASLPQHENNTTTTTTTVVSDPFMMSDHQPNLGMMPIKLLLPNLDYKVTYVPTTSKDQEDARRQEVASTIHLARNYWMKQEENKSSITSFKSTDPIPKSADVIDLTTLQLKSLQLHQESQSPPKAFQKEQPSKDLDSKSNLRITANEPLTWQQEKLIRKSSFTRSRNSRQRTAAATNPSSSSTTTRTSSTTTNNDKTIFNK